jgi:phage shock protein A
MPGFLHRLLNLVRGKANAALGRLEKPEEQLAIFVDELNSQVRELQASVASAIADEKRLKLQLDKQLEESREWERRAELALEAGDEALARQALGRKDECEATSLTLRTSWETQKEATEKLKQSLRAAKGRIEEARRRYTLLLAEYKSAQTREKIQDTLSSVPNADSPLALVGQLEEKIQAIEARTEASRVIDELEGEDIDLEARFVELEKARSGDDALEALRHRIEERKRLGDGGVSEDVDRIEALKRELDATS